MVCFAGAVNTMALSPDCGMLATTGQDSTVFLFRVASTTVYEPMGFFKLSQPAACLAWGPDSAKLLVGCRCVGSAWSPLPSTWEVPSSVDHIAFWPLLA